MTTILDLPDPFRFRDAVAAGISHHALRRALGTGLIRRVTRGWYSRSSPTIPEGEHWELTRLDHLRRLSDALRNHPGCAASHSSAAILHGLPLVISPTAEVELVAVQDYPSSRRKPGVIIHHTDSTTTEVTVVDGLVTTSIPRAIADTLRTRRLPHGLALLDQSIREGRADLESVRSELAEQRRWVGRPKALEVLELADPLRESWGESYSFGVIAADGMEVPLPQVVIYDERFMFVARLDGLIKGVNVGAEVHGKDKYFMDASSSVTPEASVIGRLRAEKRRADDIRRLGLGLAEWTVDEAMRTPDVISTRINRAAAECRGRPFTGWIRWQGAYRKLPWTGADEGGPLAS